MLGSTLYFIALLATTELDIAENNPIALCATDETRLISKVPVETNPLDDDIPLQSDTISNNDAVITPETDIKLINNAVEESNSSDNICLVDSAKKAITITNGITPEMLNYKHWTGTYTPDTFILYINEKEVPIGGDYILAPTSDPVIVRFNYSFMKGKRTGGAKIFYTIPEDTTQTTLTFSWLDTCKITIENATAIKEEKE